MPINQLANLMKKIVCAVLLFLFFIRVNAQTGGNNTYEFLNLPSSARIASMGGAVISVQDNDLNLAMQNPGLLNPSMNKQLALNYVPYFTGIKFGYVAYAMDYKDIGTFSAGIHYVDYGDFIKADNTGTITGSFGAREYSFNLAYARPVYERITAGATLKTIYSSLEEFTSVGMAVDIGAFYTSKKGNFGLGALIKNVGRQLTTYTPGNNEPLPFELQAAISYRLPKAPLRISLVATHLEKMNLTYSDPSKANETDPLTGDLIEQKISLFEKIGRHVVLSGEILITQNLNLRIGYNYMRRKDLSLETSRGISGFSAGFGFRISRFHFSYARAGYNPAGGTNHFSITTNVGDFMKKKSAPVTD